MQNILIADAGATKTEWVLLDKNGMLSCRIVADGINAAVLPDEEIRRRIADATASVRESAPETAVEEICFYGAGCAAEKIIKTVGDALKSSWPDAGSISVNSDLTAAARAALGSRKGIACILGSGSNSCLYDGSEIIDNIPSLGFILGDEGSGSAIGRRLVSDIFKRKFPEAIAEEFHTEFNLSVADVIRLVYREPDAGRFLASFTPFVARHIDTPEIHALVSDELCRFIDRNVLAYPDSTSLPVAFVGGIASAFEPILRDCLASRGISCNLIFPTPMPGLICFHSNSI